MAGHRKPHIIHVEDDPDDRALFARAFEASGLNGHLHSLASATDAVMYLNRFGPYATAHRPHLIIVDLSLPHVDGRHFIDMVRTNLQFKSIPVVVLTASTSAADRKFCRELKVEDYIVKPTMARDYVGVIASFELWLVGTATGRPAHQAHS
jgi:chemotaxis family two-component system response regulator Rcp1